MIVWIARQGGNKVTFLERLGKEWLFWDGGTGTILQSWGLKAGELPERWNIEHPEKIVELNRMYFEAGSDIVNTNTFGANSLKLPGEVEAVVTAAVENAKKARLLAGRDNDGYSALDMGPTGKLLEPLGDLPFEKALDLYKEVVRAGVKAGADLILIETMTDSYEMKAAVLAAKEESDLPVCVTMTFDEKGKLLTGGTPEAMAAMLEGLRVDAIGVNCGLGPNQLKPFVERLCDASSLPIIVNPNAGLPKNKDGVDYYDMGPEEFTDYMADIARTCDVAVLGGCCGTTPDYIRLEKEKCLAIPFRKPTVKHHSRVTSFSQVVEIGKKPVIIGERINPTGKKKFKAALKEHDINYILSQGLEQEDAGAHILDVNVGLPGIDEPAMLVEVMTKLQSVLALPLQIDTGDVVAMEKALRAYNGKPMLNSVNGKQETMDAVFPLVAKYGAVVVALALDERGIPQTSDERIEIAQKIYKEAAKYGISKDDIVIDGLAMTVSSDPTSALTTLETIRRIRDELHGHSILGVSNISFGLPNRKVLNANFFTMAMQNGLSCAIVNPNLSAMMDSYRAYIALCNLDTNFNEYITAYADVKAASVKKESQAMSLYESIKRGMDQNAAAATREGLKTKDGLTLINEELIPALDEVGKGFEKGTLFLPQLLMSAEAAKAAFAVVKESMQGQAREVKGRIILATVKGDVHDIGKNIVKVMLENYGFEVLDLGKDVPPEKIVQVALDENIRLVGLSALMTTTVVSMEETIKQLRAKKPDTLVCVGGAVMTQDYADEIGADAYCNDAMETVHYANKVFHVEE